MEEKIKLMVKMIADTNDILKQLTTFSIRQAKRITALEKEVKELKENK